MPVIAKIHTILKILDHTIFPTAMSGFFLYAATTLVANSGKLVHKATIVSHITEELTPNDIAIFTAEFTTKLPPNTSPANQPTIKIMEKKVEYVFISIHTETLHHFAR